MFNDICSIISDESTIITEIFMFDIEKSVNIMVQHWCFMEFIRFFFAFVLFNTWHIHHLYQENFKRKILGKTLS